MREGLTSFSAQLGRGDKEAVGDSSDDESGKQTNKTTQKIKKRFKKEEKEKEKDQKRNPRQMERRLHLRGRLLKLGRDGNISTAGSRDGPHPCQRRWTRRMMLAAKRTAEPTPVLKRKTTKKRWLFWAMHVPTTAQ